jgi:hypothetical protein
LHRHPVVKRRSDRSAQCSPCPSRETLPRTGSSLLPSARFPKVERRAVLRAPRGSAPGVRGTSEPAPPDDDWWAHQILIRPPESAGLPSAQRIAGVMGAARINYRNSLKCRVLYFENSVNACCRRSEGSTIAGAAACSNGSPRKGCKTCDDCGGIAQRSRIIHGHYLNIRS